MVAYSEIPELEAPARIPAKQPPASWPHSGAIEVADLAIRYQAHMPLVLKGVSLSVAAREKVRRKLAARGGALEMHTGAARGTCGLGRTHAA